MANGLDGTQAAPVPHQSAHPPPGGHESGSASFYSTAHGSGRVMSRRKARKLIRGHELQDQMARAGIVVRAASLRDLAEEAGFAYKDVHAVTAAAEAAGISRRVAHLSPVGNVKG